MSFTHTDNYNLLKGLVSPVAVVYYYNLINFFVNIFGVQSNKKKSKKTQKDIKSINKIKKK